MVECKSLIITDMLRLCIENMHSSQDELNITANG